MGPTFQRPIAKCTLELRPKTIRSPFSGSTHKGHTMWQKDTASRLTAGQQETEHVEHAQHLESTAEHNRDQSIQPNELTSPKCHPISPTQREVSPTRPWFIPLQPKGSKAEEGGTHKPLKNPFEHIGTETPARLKASLKHEDRRTQVQTWIGKLPLVSWPHNSLNHIPVPQHWAFGLEVPGEKILFGEIEGQSKGENRSENEIQETMQSQSAHSPTLSPTLVYTI